jgi:hypothetical protein
MGERKRLLALLEVYDTAISELYVLGDRGYVDLILRLERRLADAAARLAEIGSEDVKVSRLFAVETVPVLGSPTTL